ncbi:hypothetical protein H6G97_45585 [Nostoc flagelliforme FACHB-838]|uniref:Uncharacterized protein n=1 Tax=Nostoc flagelliforme FACHB-838 TaxID=2692904 RepID=A0ABR8E3H7_9NOSO|nr:hypothetical protein [Nostoc flagelliforme]MBD2536191.1 hypothetical protein [Nostoc flagelliforme FACHB-838]
MTVNNGSILTLFILIITLLALAYGFGVKARRLPFTAEIGFNQQQWQFLRWWVKLALVAGVLLPMCLLALSWKQPSSWVFWASYLLIVAVQLISEHIFSRFLVPSIVVPIGFFYTAFRLWQLLDGFTQLTFSYLTLVGFGVVVLFWVANLIMLMVMAIPTIFKGSESISQS